MKRGNFPLSRPPIYSTTRRPKSKNCACLRTEPTFCAIKKKKSAKNSDRTLYGKKVQFGAPFLARISFLTAPIFISSGRVPGWGERIKRIENNIRPSGSWETLSFPRPRSLAARGTFENYVWIKTIAWQEKSPGNRHPVCARNFDPSLVSFFIKVFLVL